MHIFAGDAGMPVTGRPPKDDARKVTRHGLTHDWIELEDVPYTGDKPNPGRMSKAAAEWWEAVSSMPHCVLWTRSDWQFAVDTLRIYRRWLATGEGSIDLKQREKVMGTTLDARRGLRIRYVTPGAQNTASSGKPTDFAAERRRRLGFDGGVDAD